VIKKQAGEKYFNIVEDIRLNSKKYRASNNPKYLEEAFSELSKLNSKEILIVAKAFTLFFYLANISEQVFREAFTGIKKEKIVQRGNTGTNFRQYLQHTLLKVQDSRL